MKALACTLGVILMLMLSWSPAAAVYISFDDVVSIGNPLVTVLETVGYRFTGLFRTIDAPGGAFVTNGSAVYIAQEAGWVGGITLSRIGGAPFDLYDFEAAGLGTTSAGSPNAQQVHLLGLQSSGALLSISYGLGSGLATFAHFVLPVGWQSLEAVTFMGLLASGASGGLALDDIGVGEGPTPTVSEPRTLLLVLTTAVGLGGVMLARRPRRRLR